jgi:hypothetical protein
MSEMDIIFQSLEASRLASEASIRAIEAVQRMLVVPVEEEGESPSEVIDLGEKPCSHSLAIKVSTVDGRFLVCDCGHQEQVSDN